MSSSANPDRPNRLVVALGIATVVLFSANLLSMISHRVWPKLQDMGIVGTQQQVDEVAPQADSRFEFFAQRHSPAVYEFTTSTNRRQHRCRGHEHADVNVQVDIERSLDSDMSRLERDIEMEMERLESELRNTELNLENAISLQLHLDGENSVVFDERKLDLSEWEKKVEGITKKFEIRVLEHEAAAQTKHLVMRKRRN